jgi:hypothetical protein
VGKQGRKSKTGSKAITDESLTKLLDEVEARREEQGDFVFRELLQDLAETAKPLDSAIKRKFTNLLVLSLTTPDLEAKKRVNQLVELLEKPATEPTPILTLPKTTLYPRLTQSSIMSNGQTVEEYRRTATHCFYCNVKLIHSLPENLTKQKIKGLRVTLSAVDHVYPNELAIRHGQYVRNAEASPVWWNRYLTDLAGTVIVCYSCNSSKGEKLLKDWEPPTRPYRAGAKVEAEAKFEYIKVKYNFTSP